MNNRGIKIIKDGKVSHVRDVKPGDQLAATIVSQGAPVVVTEQEVQATLAQATPATSGNRRQRQRAPPATPAAPAASAEPRCSRGDGSLAGDVARFRTGRIVRTRDDGMGDHHPAHRRGAVLFLAPTQAAVTTRNG